MFAYNAHPVNFGNNENNIEKKKKNKTIKNKKVKAILQHIEPFDNNNNNNELGEFKPPPKAISMGVENTINKENNNHTSDHETDDDDETNNDNNDNEINIENYKELNSQNEHLYNNDKYVPYYTNISNNHTINNNELVKKLNYMIHLLEENKNIETESVSEDVILYSFLGVFIIFVIDSFSRANKYIR